MHKDNKELRVLLKEAQSEVLSVGDEAFDKAKVQALVLQPDLNIGRMDFFKVIRDGQLVDPESDISKTEEMLEKKPSI